MLVLACSPSTWEAEEGCNLRPASVTEGEREFERGGGGTCKSLPRVGDEFVVSC